MLQALQQGHCDPQLDQQLQRQYGVSFATLQQQQRLSQQVLLQNPQVVALELPYSAYDIHGNLQQVSKSLIFVALTYFNSSINRSFAIIR